MTTMQNDRFVNSAVSDLLETNRNPIFGYQDLPVLPLEKAVESIVPFASGLMGYVAQAKEKCNRNSTVLTLDESAAIYLYSMPKSFFSKLNDALRAENRHALKPWFAFLKLFMTALEKLPSREIRVWRGVVGDVGSNFVENDVQTWWSVNSCSTALDIVGPFVGEKGVLFAIDAIHAKDISAYSAFPREQEVVLIPGTRVRVKGNTFKFENLLFIVHLEEQGSTSSENTQSCTSMASVAIPEGKHVMLSYNWYSQEIVHKIYYLLRDQKIPVWFDIQGDKSDNAHKSMAEGVENAEVVCSFVTPEYQESINCQLELQYARKRHKHIIPCILSDRKTWKPSGWLELVIAVFGYIDFHDDSEANIHVKVRELIDRIREQSPAAHSPVSQPLGEPSYLFELIRHEYQRNSRIERIMNPAISFPIEQSYINLAIVETREQQQKEKKLLDAQHSDAIMGTFEEIYGIKTPIDIKDIFKICKDQMKILVFGRAGIGKTTFCRYAAYQWATGAIWPQYDLIVLIPLRSLTESRYPPLASGADYTLIDLMKKEYFCHGLSDRDEKLLRKQFDPSQILWLLDGYDEIVQNIPAHLQYLLEQLLKTPHHILTSRPYLNTLSYTVQMEITGFTDNNIAEYVKQFFNQIQDQMDNASVINQQLLTFLKRSPSIWGVAHIPVNLELICSLWSNTDWSETKSLTMTGLYDNITEWLCRRYLTKQNIGIRMMSKEEIYQCCHKQLAFLESMAFNGMENSTIILKRTVLQKALKEAQCSLQDHPHLLNIGILKSLNYQPTGNQIEAEKDHYFVHLSFQEHFAARYLVHALNSPTPQKAIDFINRHKYNQRFTLVLTFASGLLIESDAERCIDTFWDTILGEPLDLVGLRHTQLIISCIEETGGSLRLRRRTELMDTITKWIRFAASVRNDSLADSLRVSPSLVHEPTIQETLIKLLENKDPKTKANVLSFISRLQISNPSTALINLLLTQLDDKNKGAREDTCVALAMMGEEAATNDVINRLLTLVLGDMDYEVRHSASVAVGKMGEKAATTDVINRLVAALGNENKDVRGRACQALGEMGEKVATTDVINRLVAALGDQEAGVRMNVCQALGMMGEKVATNDVINGLVAALEDENEGVRGNACTALGVMGEKAATKSVINRLVAVLLGDQDTYVRWTACEALWMMGEKAATNDGINRLVAALEDENEGVRMAACTALGMMGKKAATNDVINGLVATLGDENEGVRGNACTALGVMGEKAATTDVINRLVTALGDQDAEVRRNACESLGKMGEKAATNGEINILVAALGDQDAGVRRNACESLGKMGEKAATNDAIDRLVAALGDKDMWVRRSACKALGRMGEKGATNDVINRLVAALGDKDMWVRRSACKALGRMGEKAATNYMINRLVAALGDENEDVRGSACEVLGEMGEKAATTDVINRLVTALGDQDAEVRRNACESLRMMGEKAATNGVINILVAALGDENKHVRMNACEALGKMGEKAATNGVIEALLDVCGGDEDWLKTHAAETLGKFLHSFSAIANLDSIAVSKLVSVMNKTHLVYLSSVPSDQFIKVFLYTKSCVWLPVATIVALLQGNAVTITEDTIVVYGSKEPLEAPVFDRELREQLIKAFFDQGERLDSSAL